MNNSMPIFGSPLMPAKSNAIENTHISSIPRFNNQLDFKDDEMNSLIEDLNNLLECSICRERYAKPKMLPCQHAFCSECLTKLKKRMNWNCPICRKYFPPNTSRSCLLLNNLIELASNHSCLSAPRESTPSPHPDHASVDDNYEIAFSFDLSELEHSGLYTDEEDDEYVSEDASGLGDTDESISSYLTRNRMLNYDELILNLNDFSPDSSYDIFLSSSPFHTNSSPSQPTRTHANRRRRFNNPHAAANTNNTNSHSNTRVVRATDSEQQRIFRRCPNWPWCHDDVVCNYTHPRRQCRNNPCRFGSNCCFLHSRDMPSFRGIVR